MIECHKKDNNHIIWVTGILILLLQLTFHLSVDARQVVMPDTIQTELSKQLNDPQFLKQLNFPNTVKKLYALSANNTHWLRPEENNGPTSLAMLLLDCVKQYGLQPKNYHPEMLTYSNMKAVKGTEIPHAVAEKVKFEIMLSDAMVSLINHLHYGVLNPVFTPKALDAGKDTLQTELVLMRAAQGQNLMDTILSTQPTIHQYQQLQGYLKLMAGQYQCDSYQTTEAEMLSIAVNMERLRWSEIKAGPTMVVNIPAYRLLYRTPDSVYIYKVVVGKPSTPTPRIGSIITYLETAPDWNIPKSIFTREMLPKAAKNRAYFDNNNIGVYDKQEKLITITAKSLAQIRNAPNLYHARQSPGCDNALGKVIFRFNNPYSIYLHDSPEPQYFSRAKRALSHGCIRVEGAEALAALVLTNDHQPERVKSLIAATAGYTKQRYSLKTPIPILITYLTVVVENGILVHFDDIYNLDKGLTARLVGK